MKTFPLILGLLLTLDCFGQGVRPALIGASRRVEAVASSPTPDLLWWKLNEGSGTALASSATDTTHGGTTDASWVTGKSGSGGALDFNGTSHDSAMTNTVAFGTNKLTVSFWLYLDSTAGTQIIFESSESVNSNPDGFAAFIDAGVLNLRLMDNASGNRIEAMTIPATGAWHHYLVLLDNSSANGDVRAWLDGSEQTLTLGTDTKGVARTFATYVLYVGARASNDLFYNGRLDDFRVYAGDYSGSVAAIYADPQ
jgi:hypothetical protein